MFEHTCKCDVCGVQKAGTAQEGNGWLIGCLTNVSVGRTLLYYAIRQWDADASMNPSVHHLCGMVCACKMLNSQLEKQRKEQDNGTTEKAEGSEAR